MLWRSHHTLKAKRKEQAFKEGWRIGAWKAN
jgi:hypothetical protein